MDSKAHFGMGVFVGAAFVAALGAPIIGNRIDAIEAEARVAQEQLEIQRDTFAQTIRVLDTRILAANNQRQRADSLRTAAEQRRVEYTERIDTIIERLPPADAEYVRQWVTAFEMDLKACGQQVSACDEQLSTERERTLLFREQLGREITAHNATQDRLERALAVRKPSRFSLSIGAGYAVVFPAGQAPTYGPAVFAGVSWRLF